MLNHTCVHTCNYIIIIQFLLKNPKITTHTKTRVFKNHQCSINSNSKVEERCKLNSYLGRWTSGCSRQVDPSWRLYDITPRQVASYIIHFNNVCWICLISIPPTQNIYTDNTIHTRDGSKVIERGGPNLRVRKFC